MLDVLVISLGAIVGANARYFISRYAAQTLGPVFPYGTLIINISRQLDCRLLRHLDIRASAGRSALALAGGGRILRRLHHFLQLCLRKHGLFRAGAVASDARQHLQQQSSVPGRGPGGYGAREGAVKCQTEWQFKSPYISTKRTSGITVPCTWKFSTILRKENVYAATALHAVAGFLGRQQVKTSHFVDAGGKLPVVIIFVDTDEHVSRVLPTLKEMAAHRLIVRENVVLEQGSLD